MNQEFSRIFHSLCEQCPILCSLWQAVFLYLTCARNMENNTLTVPQTQVMHLPNTDWWARKNIFSEPFLSPPRKIYRSTTNGLTYASYKHSLQARARKRQPPSTSGLVNRLERLAGTNIERVQRSPAHGLCLPVLRNRACGISPLRYMGLFLLQIKSKRICC